MQSRPFSGQTDAISAILGSKISFVSPAPKMNSVLTVESSLEFDACFHFEYSPQIERFEAQPKGFYYSFNGRDCGYTPDFAVVEKGVRRFIEVKPQRKTLHSDFRSRFYAKQIRARV